MRHGREHIIGAAAFGREAIIGHAGRMEVEREVIGQLTALAKYLGNEFLIAVAEQDDVVLHIGMLGFQAEVNHETATWNGICASALLA